MTGRTANYGMGGEFVINKQATAAHLPLLQAINAQGFANGGQLGSSDNLTYLLKQLSDQGIITTGTIAGLVEAGGGTSGVLNQQTEATRSFTQATQQSTVATKEETGAKTAASKATSALGNVVGGYLTSAAIGVVAAINPVAGLLTAVASSAFGLSGVLSKELASAFKSIGVSIAEMFGMAETAMESADRAYQEASAAVQAMVAKGYQGWEISALSSTPAPDYGQYVDVYGNPFDLDSNPSAQNNFGIGFGPGSNMSPGGLLGEGSGGSSSNSGTHDDSGSNSQDGDRWASGGQAGSNYIVNKRATAKYLPLLASLNSRGFADGGLMDNNTYSRYHDTVRFNGLEDYQIAFIELNESFEDGIKELQELGASEEQLSIARAAQAIEIRKMINDTIASSQELVDNYGLSDYAIQVNELNAKYQEQLDTLIYLSAAEEDLNTVRRAQQIETDAMIESLVASSRELLEDSKLSDQQKAVRDLNAAYDEKIANLKLLKAAEEQVALVEQARAYELSKLTPQGGVSTSRSYLTELGSILNELGKPRTNQIGSILADRRGWDRGEMNNIPWIGSDAYDEVNQDLANKIMGGRTMRELYDNERIAREAAARGARQAGSANYDKSGPSVGDKSNSFSAASIIDRTSNLLADALRKAEAALSEAENALKDSFSAYNTSLIEKFDAAMTELDKTISSASDSVNTLSGALDSIYGMEELSQYNYAKAQAELAGRFSTGNTSGDMSGLSYSTAFDKNTFGSKLDYSRSVARTGIMLTGLKGIADSNLDLLEKQKSDETKRHEEVLKSNEERLNALLGIDTSVLSVKEAAELYLQRRKGYDQAFNNAVGGGAATEDQRREFNNTVADVAREIQALRAEMKAQQHAAVVATQEMTRYIRRWDGDGMPETRVV